ncbi:MAG: hypothetical protein GXY23_05780 [Myxococcales bacterium]|nr:hypothetical protein [Myxococcales bacterium]
MSRAPHTLHFDASAERSHARLRGMAALVMLPAALLLLLRGGLLGKLLGVAGTLVSVMWMRRAAKAPAPPLFARIDLVEDALLLHGTHVAREIRYDAIERVEADEERLVVAIVLRDGERVELPPGYGGLGVEALAHRIDGFRRRHLIGHDA